MSNDQLIKELQETIKKLKEEILEKEKIVGELMQQIEEQNN
ncbi:MAG: hypothetical protein U0M92_01355 [Bacilli bacterium]